MTSCRQKVWNLESTSERVNLGGKIELVTTYDCICWQVRSMVNGVVGGRLLLVEINAIDGLKLPSYSEIYAN